MTTEAGANKDIPTADNDEPNEAERGFIDFLVRAAFKQLMEERRAGGLLVAGIATGTSAVSAPSHAKDRQAPTRSRTRRPPPQP